MKKTLLAALTLCVSLLANATIVNYTADDTTIFPNPERGFIDQLSRIVDETTPNVVKGHTSYFTKTGERQEQRLVLCLYYLNNYKNTPTLPNKILNAFDEDMQVLRNYGFKCILRFAYSKGGSPEDAPLDIVVSHINQLRSHWQANADVIFVLQAGFIGSYGEWYYTDNFDNKSVEMTTARREVVDSLLSAMPADRFIQLRCPSFKIGYVGDENPLTEAEAFTGSARARLAYHNDAFLNKYGDEGTYNIKRNGKVKEDTAALKPYVAAETFFVPLGGETNIEDQATADLNATYEKTTAEMSRLHWTFCKAGYAETTTDKWRDEGTFAELSRKMGYRYQLVSATLPDQAVIGSQANINIQICNVGYAPLYNERPVYLVLKNSSHTYSIPLQSDPRRWLPNGVVSTINQQIAIPSSAAEGTYQLYLHMPDKYASLAGDPRYAVRFANENIWDSATGMNSLNASLELTNATVTPPDPNGDAIELPATLDKANIFTVSNDMTYYNIDYFDFGPDDHKNLDRWAEWKVYLSHPGEYQVTTTGYYLNGHRWQLQLLESGAADFSCKRNSTKNQVTTITETELWNLSAVPAGEYTLRVINIEPYSQCKLLSVSLQADNVQTGIEDVAPEQDNQAYDILGRPVDNNYHGIVIQNGQKRIQ